MIGFIRKDDVSPTTDITQCVIYRVLQGPIAKEAKEARSYDERVIANARVKHNIEIHNPFVYECINMCAHGLYSYKERRKIYGYSSVIRREMLLFMFD